ncbi:hypothetical protein [Pseudodesulfovibrio sp.]|uniref:hypothetical protein n=1 Tax=Pseudodesulfovibrio sp. TaxID=2035812 RepID=UPI0026127622|nr:hypothetical protein [Pseudodesulfovibrio sp.]MDD3311274.1 hypothetical protein [Pseudodesulfovibrio sp.]
MRIQGFFVGYPLHRPGRSGPQPLQGFRPVLKYSVVDGPVPKKGLRTGIEFSPFLAVENRDFQAQRRELDRQLFGKIVDVELVKQGFEAGFVKQDMRSGAFLSFGAKLGRESCGFDCGFRRSRDYNVEEVLFLVDSIRIRHALPVDMAYELFNDHILWLLIEATANGKGRPASSTGFHPFR